MIRTHFLLAAGLLAACAPHEAGDAVAAQHAKSIQTHPVSGLKVVPLTITSDDTSAGFRVEIAQSDAEQAKGLMFRTQLAPDEGMIFPRNPPDIASFWMKNTPLPLDIIFVGEDGRILNIAANTVPYSLDPVGAEGLTSLVLEIPGGRAAQLGIEAGDLVEWRQ